MFGKYRRTAICKFPDIESLLHRIDRSQFLWFGHVDRMPHVRLPKQALYVEVSGRVQLEDHEQDGLIISRILVGTIWDFLNLYESFQFYEQG